MLLLAYRMNGNDVPPEHGFPVRAIVPAGTLWRRFKWLQRIIVTDQLFAGYYQTLDYAYWKRRGTLRSSVRSQNCGRRDRQPAQSDKVPSEFHCAIHGAGLASGAKSFEWK